MRLRLRWLILSILLVAAAPALADIKPAGFDFPPDDTDLQQAISAAAAYEAAAVCDMECPKTDCAAAKEALQALSDMQSYLKELVTALGAANADALAHFQSLAKNSITNADQQAKTIWAIGVHEALHNFGSALLSIASVTSFAKDFATNPKAFEDLSPVEMLDRLNSWASALRSLESGVNTLAKAQGAKTSTPITGKFDIAGGVDTKSINDQISTINDIKKTINAALKNGKDWKSALSKSGGAAALGQLAGRFLKLYSEDLLKERKAAMEELLRDAAAGDLVQANSYRTLQRIQARRFLAEDALLAAQKAFDAYAACVAKVCGASTISRPAIPNFTAQVPGAGKKYSWGEALRWLNGAIQATLPRLVPAGFYNDCPKSAQQPFEFILGWGSTIWCQYDPGAPMTPIPGGGPGTTDGGPQTDGPLTGGGPQQADGGGSTPTPTSSGTTPSGSSSGSTPGPTPPGGMQTTDGGGTTPPPESILDDIDEDDDDHEDDPRDVPTIPLIIKATAQAQAAGATQSAIGSQQVKLFPDSVQNVALPSPGAQKPQTDAGADPVTCTTGADGACMVHVNPCDFGACTPGAPPPATPMEVQIAPSAVTSFNLEVRPGTPLIPALTPYQTDALLVGGRSFVTLTSPLAMGSQLRNMIGGQPGLISFEENYCRDKQASAPNDPYFAGTGAWGQKHDDQSGLKRIGLTAGADSAWNLLGTKPQPVIVAVIDTGLDWNHLDFDWASLWRNPREKPDNGQDDDGNGYVDDVIGWDFLANGNRPWDHDGHGTLVAGIIAAAGNNKTGIAGINPHARIMVLKALNAFGQTRASFIAKALTYAADNGARIANLSVGGKNLTEIEKAAIAYARSKGVLVVVAAGNEGVEVKGFGPAGADGVVTVAATNLDDSHPAFSNWGPEIDLAAPGVDILSLRARRTDTVLGVPGVDYKAGSAYVGKDKRYYRVSGTSFAAPFVAGVASLVLSKNPALTVEQLETVLKNSAEDVQVPGKDQFSGAGMVHAGRALALDPSFAIEAAITGVEVVQLSGKPAVQVLGSATADAFAEARLELGEGEKPTKFKTVAQKVPAVAAGPLAVIPADAFRGVRLWTIRLVVSHRNGETREARYLLDTGQ